MTQRNITSIRVTVEVREELKKIGRKGEDYSSIIQRLLDQYNAAQR